MAKTIKELTQDLLQAPSACKEVKEAAQNYLDAAGTEKEADAATAYVKELEADIMPIDGLISFAGLTWAHRYLAQMTQKRSWLMLRRSKLPVQNTVTAQHVQPAKHF